MSEPVRWGIVSTAKIARLVLAGARKSDRVQVLAVGSRDEQRATRFAGEHGIERAYGSYEALLADPDVEAVYIGLPNSLHVLWSIGALEAGKHVLCEKPLTRRPEEAEAAFDAAERAGRLLMEAFMYRHNPQTRMLEQLVDEGAIGELRLIRSAFSFSLTELGNVRMRPELDGGALMDVGCYCVNASRLLAGEPERVTGEQVLAPTGVDVRFAGTMRFAGDVVAHFDAAFDVPCRAALEVVGSQGSLVVADPWHVRSPGIDLVRDGVLDRIEIPVADSYQLELENLSAAIRGEAEPLLGRADAVGQARALESLYRSV
jgi:D-xylose 1-dehydrogenase (NADP+, D-xylono-1,5-lactone-forming)